MPSGSDLPTYRTLHVDVDRGVATITLNRPHRRNAVGDGMREELADAYLWCDAADAIRVVVLTGAPPAFCAGADLAAGERTFTEPGPTFSAAGIDVPDEQLVANLVWAAGSRPVREVWVAGEQVVADGEPTKVDRRRAQADVAAATARVRV